MGVELCAETSADEIVSTISEETGKFFFPQIEEVDTGTVVRLITLTMDIYYGGTSWSYIDVYLNEDSKVICVRLNASFESIDRAKDHFTVMKSTLEQTYGKGNEVDENIAFWTDDTNSVRISYEESNGTGQCARCLSKCPPAHSSSVSRAPFPAGRVLNTADLSLPIETQA